MSDRSGCALVELTVLEALDAITARRPRAYASSAKALAGIDERIGLGPRYGYDLLLDLARPWVIPVRTVLVAGNYGDRGSPVPADPEYTHCRPSLAGQLALDAESDRLPPVPVGLINGTIYRGGIQPPLDPFRVFAALRRLLEDPRVTDSELNGIVGAPWSGTGCTVTVDLPALTRGRRTMLRESGQITITGDPVPEEPADTPPAPTHDRQYYAYAGMGGEPFLTHVVIESLPARTVASEVTQAIADRAAERQPPASDQGMARRAGLPIAYIDDQSSGNEVRILLALRPGSDPVSVRDRLATIVGVSAEVPSAFPSPLAVLLRSWVDRHRGEDIATSLTELEKAIYADRQRETRSLIQKPRISG